MLLLGFGALGGNLALAALGAKLGGRASNTSRGERHFSLDSRVAPAA